MIQSPDQALAILGELNRRKAVRHSLIDRSFPAQANLIEDPSRLKAALCTRRAGKSVAAGRGLYQACLAAEGSASLYIGLTQDSAHRIMWNDVLRDLDDKLELGAQFHESSLTVSLPSRSSITLLGADASEKEMRKFLGGKYKRVIIDEAGAFRIDLHKLVYEMIKPATADYLGDIWLIGTPDDLTQGLFYEVTRQDDVPRLSDWSVHEWTAYDNPYMVRQWTEEINGLIKNNPRIAETPLFQRMYLGKWATDFTKLVYKYARDRNSAQELPNGDWTYVLGVDLGFEDASAFVVCAYSPGHRQLYIVDVHKKSGMIISDVAERIRYYQRKYDIHQIVIDNAAKQAVEEMRQRYQLPLTPAEKQGKAEFIEIMNSELISGNILLVDGAADALVKEWGALIWDDRSAKRQEHPNCENHLSDAALYGFRQCYQYLYQAPAKRQTAEEKLDQWEEREAERLQRKEFIPFWMREDD